MKPKLVGIKTSELVILAIHNLEATKKKEPGFNLQEITQYISDKYNVDYTSMKPIIKSALVKGLKFGILNYKNGRYQLEEVPEPPLIIQMKNDGQNQRTGRKANKSLYRRKRKLDMGKSKAKTIHSAGCDLHGGKEMGNFLCEDCCRIDFMKGIDDCSDDDSDADETEWKPPVKCMFKAI